MRQLATIAAAGTLALAACNGGDTQPEPEPIDTSTPAVDDTADAGPPPGPEGDDGVLGSDAVRRDAGGATG